MRKRYTNYRLQMAAGAVEVAAKADAFGVNSITDSAFLFSLLLANGDFVPVRPDNDLASSFGPRCVHHPEKFRLRQLAHLRDVSAPKVVLRR